MSQGTLSGLSLLLVENEQAINLHFRKIIQQFARVKARRKNVESPITCKQIT